MISLQILFCLEDKTPYASSTPSVTRVSSSSVGVEDSHSDILVPFSWPALTGQQPFSMMARYLLRLLLGYVPPMGGADYSVEQEPTIEDKE